MSYLYKSTLTEELKEAYKNLDRKLKAKIERQNKELQNK